MIFRIDSTVKNVIISVLSGISVSFILYILNNYWKNTIAPWYENRIYKDLKIEGKWYGLTFGIRQDIIVIKRKGHLIEGNMVCINGVEKGEEYIINGSFKNMVLSLLYETKDKTKSDRGSLTMMAKNNGCRLKGKIAYYDNNSDVINVGNIIWFREKNDLDTMIKVNETLKDEITSTIAEKTKLEQKESEIEKKIENKIIQEKIKK